MFLFKYKRPFLFFITILVIVLYSFLHADQQLLNEQTVYSIINKSDAALLNVYHEGRLDYTDFEKFNYDYSSREGELSALQDNGSIGQTFYLKQDGQGGHIILSKISEEPLFLNVYVDEKIQEGLKITVSRELAEDKLTGSWKIEEKPDGYCAILSKEDETLALTSVGLGHVRVTTYDGNPKQLWKFSAKYHESFEGIEIPLLKNHRMERWFDLMTDYAAISKHIDFDGYYGAQCVDLAYHYTHALFHVDEGNFAFKKSINGGNGGEIFDRANPNGSLYYERYKYYKGFIAQRGDLVVFRYNLSRGQGSSGHVAVVESATEDVLNVVTQNGSNYHTYVKKDIYRYSEYAPYNYEEIIGFLRPIKSKICD